MEGSQRIMSASVAAPRALSFPNRTRLLPRLGTSDRTSSLAAALSLHKMPLELSLILVYVVAATVGDLKVGKVSVQIGAVPVFFTDITLILILLISFIRWPARVLYWVSVGTGAGLISRGVWVLCLLAIVYFALAVPEYHLYALRDLAIFGYSLFFPLTYFAIRDRRDAAKVLWYFIYSSVILAVIVLLQFAIGGVRGHLALVDSVSASLYMNGIGEGVHSSFGRAILQLTNDDDASFAVFALAALASYIILDRRWRRFHILCAIACFLALAVATSRAAVVGLTLASAVTFICLGAGYRVRHALFVAICALTVIASSAMPHAIPGVNLMRGLRTSVLNAIGGPSVDPTSEFRMIRWSYATDLWLGHPMLGVGFGCPIIPAGLVDENEGRGEYNVGMPHNTFLFLAARTGIVGLGVVLFCWIGVFRRLVRKFRGTRGPDELAMVNILMAMFGFAMFVLFFERPVTNAMFWILMAVGARLAAYEEPGSVG